jgi:hypothetical protein
MARKHSNHRQTQTLSYGSRHLANKWVNTKLSAFEKGPKCQLNNQLESIELYVLLDLIGCPNPVFKNYYTKANSFFQKLVNIGNDTNLKFFLKFNSSSFLIVMQIKK